jgi:hypothetical protein
MKRRLGWAGLAAVVGCGACCAAIPALSALGLGGMATALARWIGPGTELFVGGAAGALAFGVMMIRERGRKTACAWPGVAAAPIACTADLRNEKAVQEYMERYKSVFEHLVHSERLPSGFRWAFRAEPGLEARLKELASLEHECCGFFSFELSSDRDRITWTVTADERAQSVVDEFFRLPERLAQEPRTGHDLVSLRRKFESAGLAFTGAKARS